MILLLHYELDVGTFQNLYTYTQHINNEKIKATPWYVHAYNAHVRKSINHMKSMCNRSRFAGD